MKNVLCRILLSTIIVLAGALIPAAPFSVRVAHAQNPPSVVVARGVQTGTIVFGTGAGQSDVTTGRPNSAIVATVTLGTTVDSTKAFIQCSFSTTQAQAITHPTCELSDTTVTITIAANPNAAAHTTVRWYVAEFEGNVVVKRGLATFTTTGADAGTASSEPFNGAAAGVISIGATIDCTKSFVLTSERVNLASNTLDEEWQAAATLVTTNAGSAPRAVCTSTTTFLELFRNRNTANGTPLKVAWQVIQMDGTQVQRGRACIGGTGGSTPCSVSNGTTATAALSPTVTPGKTLVLTTQRAGSAIGGEERFYRVRADLNAGGTQLTLNRGGSSTGNNVNVLLTWEVVAFQETSTISVSRNAAGSDAMMSGGSTNTASFATVFQARTVPFVSASYATSGTGFHADTSIAVQTNQTTLTFTRSSTSNTLTVDWQAVQFFGCSTDPTLCHLSVSALSGTTADSASVRISWWPVMYVGGSGCFSAGISPSTCNVMVLRAAFAPGQTPSDIVPTPGSIFTDGTSYTPGVLMGGGVCTPTNGSTTNPCVVHDGMVTASAVATFATDCWNSLVQCGGGNLKNDGTTYVYRVYVRSPTGCGSPPCWTTGTLLPSISQVTVTPKIRNGAGGSGLQWVYHHNGGAALNSPIEDTNNKVYVSLANNRIVSLDTSTGAELSLPVVTPAQAMGYPSWWPVDLAGTQTRVAFGDQNGYVTVFDGLTGKRVWTRRVHTDPENSSLGNIQAAVVVQTQLFSNGVFKNHYTNNYSYSGDVIFAGTRNITPNMGPNANLNRRNKIYALRATDGSLLWTFDPNNAAGDCNPQQAMDILVGTPWVDYDRNTLYVTSEDGPTAGQNSLWFLDTLGPTTPGGATDDCRGTLKNVQGTLLDIDFTIWQSYDAKTFYFQSTPNCFLYGYDADSQAPRISDSLVMTGTAGCLVKGSLWQDYNKYLLGLRRFYLVTAAGGVWCLDDNGNQTMARCPIGEWPDNPIYQHSTGGDGTASGATLLASGVLGEPHFWLGGGTNGGDMFGRGTLFQLSTANGAREKTFTLDSTATLGELSISATGDALFVGSSSGRVYRVNLTGPFQCPGGGLCTYGSLP